MDILIPTGKAEVDLRHPVIFYKKNTCPFCREQSTIVFCMKESNIMGIDEFGNPISDSIAFYDEVFYCLNCHKKFDKLDFIRLEDGSYKYVTEAERIYQENRLNNLKAHPITHLHAVGNPFIVNDKEK